MSRRLEKLHNLVTVNIFAGDTVHRELRLKSPFVARDKNAHHGLRLIVIAAAAVVIALVLIFIIIGIVIG